MNLKGIITASALAGTLAMGAVAVAQTSSANNTYAVRSAAVAAPFRVRGERGSARNLAMEIRAVERAIDGLQRDRHDYGGHREQAIDLLQRGRVQLQLALQYDATHPGQ